MRTVLALGMLVAPLAVAGCDNGSDAPTCSDKPGEICTWAGTGEAGFDGDGHSLAKSTFYWPIDVTFTATGGYIVDWNNHRVRQILSDNTLKTIFGTDCVGDGPSRTCNPERPPGISDLMPPGAPGTEIDLNHPSQFVPMPDGKFILVSWHNHKLRQFDPATGLAFVICGGAPGYAGDGGPMLKAKLDQPQTVVLRPDGGMYILDQRNHVIRAVDAAGIMSTVAFTAKTKGFAGDGGPPLAAMMAQPDGSNPQPGGGMALDAMGRLYVSDVLNHRVRRIDFAANRVDTVVGNGMAGFAGDGGPGLAASLNNPRKLAVGPDGRVYIGDEMNHRIRAFDPTTGIVTTVVGNGVAAFAGDGGPATLASVQRPAGVAFANGYMFVLDTYNHRIRRIRL